MTSDVYYKHTDQNNYNLSMPCSMP